MLIHIRRIPFNRCAGNEHVMTRRLMLIPIVHSEKEMGSLKSDISEMIDRKFGKEKRDQHRKDVALFWDCLLYTSDAADE